MALLLKAFKRIGLAFIILIVLYAIGRPIQIWLGSFYSGERAPYLQMMSSNAVTLRWQSEQAYTGVIHYGDKETALSLSLSETELKEEHELRLSGLQPGTKYFYSLGDSSKEYFKGKDFWFKTAPNKPQQVRFWVTGDQGYPNRIQNEVRDSALSWSKTNSQQTNNATQFDFWITTGDNAYRSGTNEQFQKGFFDPYKSILQNTPVWPAYGNHDARRWAFFDIFSLPTKAESGGIPSGSEHFYSFDYANIHVVMLDSQDSSYDLDGEMLTWLKKDLKQTKQQWLIAVFHHPPYSKGTHDSDSKRDSRGRLVSVRENILPILEKFGVDVVLSGHSHMYERSDLIGCHYGYSSSFNKNMVRAKGIKLNKKEKHINAHSGTIYAVIGSSSKVDDGPLNHPAMPHSLKQAGSMIFDVNRNSLKAYFINKDGKVNDQFEILKGMEKGVTTRSCL